MPDGRSSDLGARLRNLAQSPPVGYADVTPPTAPRPSDVQMRRASSNGQRVHIDWKQVRSWRQQAAEQLTAQLANGDGVTEHERHAMERSIVSQLLREYNAAQVVHSSGPEMDEPELAAYAQALLDSMPPRLGRMQPLVDNPDYESIRITGYDNVQVVHADGRTEFVESVAESDEELIADLQFIGAHAPTGERPFSRANWSLDLDLPGNARLAAVAWVSERPLVTIRRHRLFEVTLDELVVNGTMSADCAQFLQAAVRADKSIVVSGRQTHGKTTLVRALISAIEPDERIGTVETEYELGTHRWESRKQTTVALQATPGSGERGFGGAAGEVTLDELIFKALRMDLSRIIVGEVRGGEVQAMLKAMQIGPGSISTVHAKNAKAVVKRLVTLAKETGGHIEEFAYEQIAEHIDLIVHVQMDPHPTAPGMSRRYVSEIRLVEPGEGAKPATTQIYRPGPNGRAQYAGCPAHLLADLRAAGLPPFSEPGVGWDS